MRIVFSLFCALLGFHVGLAGLGQRRADVQPRYGTVNRTETTQWKSQTDSPIETAFSFMRAEGQLLGLTPEQTTFMARGAEVVPGGSHVRLVQTFRGIPVLDSETIVSINSRNEVVMVSGGSRPVNVSNTHPALTPEEAFARAIRYLRIRGEIVQTNSPPDLIIASSSSGQDRLVYRCLIVCSDPLGDWEILVDADSGELVAMEDRFVQYEHVQGSGYVYLPDPISRSKSSYGLPGFDDNNDAASHELNFHRTMVTLDSILFGDGVYQLSGPYCTINDIEAPYHPESYTSPKMDGFMFDRSQQGFEAVNAYYHVTESYQRLLELGFVVPSLEKVQVDPHGYYGEDNSHYSPTGNWISFGEGGVDDAEDASVIWHEHAHAIQYNINPVWGGGETRALGEGFGDYWAASYAGSFTNWGTADEQANWLFLWDGHNPFWPGRVLNDDRSYPFGNLSAHDAGQIWSSALMGIWRELGKDITDKLVIKSQYYLGYGVTATDAARAILQADRDLYGGAHLSTLVYWLGTVKKFLDPVEEIPVIAHTPPTGPGVSNIRATIETATPLAENAVMLCWAKNGGTADTVFMTREGDSPTFVATVPTEVTEGSFEYYIVAVDRNGGRAVAPRLAPAEVYSIALEPGPVNANRPDVFVLDQNYPNPFNPSTTISFTLPEDASVRLTVYDMLGREVAELVDAPLSSGTHHAVWQGRNSQFDLVASGMYLYRIIARSVSGEVYTDSRKMLFTR
jgi:hypothetical protein